MNSLVIPPSANWYETAILACAPDNTVIYGARNEIVIIYHSPQDQTADVKIIPRAHSQKVTSVSINKNWGQPHKLIVTSSEDKIIKLWNVETLEIKFSHNGHKVHGKIIAATFAGDERVISVSEEGAIIVWNVSLNEINLLKDIFGFKVTVTCISTCPHASWLTAFGLKNGLVVVADLRKQGKLLYKLRGHDKSVLSLAWCPAPVNIFPKDPNNYVGVKKVNDQSGTEINEANSTSKCDTSDEDRNRSEVKISKRDVWMNLTHADDDDLPEEYKIEHGTDRLSKLFSSGDYDFLRECNNLKKQILGTNVTDISCGAVAPEINKDRPVLKAKKSLNKQSQRGENSGEINSEEISNVLNENDQVQQVTSTETEVENVEVEREDELGVTEMVQFENFDDQEENNHVLSYIASKTKFEDVGIKKDEMDTVVRTSHANEEMKENTGSLEESNHILNAFIAETKLEKNAVATSGQVLNETTTEKAEIVLIKKEEKSNVNGDLEDVDDSPVESYKHQCCDDRSGHSQTVETLHIRLQESKQPLEETAVKTEAEGLKIVEKEMEEDIDQSNDTEVGKNDKSRTNDPYIVCNIVDNILNELGKSVEVGTRSDIYETLHMKNGNMNSFNKSKGSVDVNQKSFEDANVVEGQTVGFIETLQIEDSNVNPFNKSKDSVDVDQESVEDASAVEGQTVGFTETLQIKDSIVNSFNKSKDSVDVDQKRVEDASAVEGQTAGVTEALQIEDSNKNSFNKSKESVDLDQKSVEDASTVEGQTVEFTETLQIEDSNVNPFNKSKDSAGVDKKSIVDGSVTEGQTVGFTETLQLEDSNVNSFNNSKDSVDIDKKSVEDASAVEGQTVGVTEALQLEDSNVNSFNNSKNSVNIDQKSVEDASAIEGQTVAFTETLQLEDSNVNSFNNSKDSVDIDKKSVEDASAVEGQTVAFTEENKEKVLAKVPVEEEPRKEFLLASSAREGNIYIWRAGTDGRMQTFLTIPNKPNHRRAPKSNADKTWIILCWVTPTTLLSSCKSGELVQWLLPKSKDKSKQFRTVHKDHKSLLFNIAAPIVLLNEYNWLDEKFLNVWTIGQDRLLLNTSLSSGKTNLACYPTIGLAECFALSPLDPNRLAVGTGEAIVKIWDLSRPHIKNIIMTNFYQKIQSKVVTLAWHPTNELILAYGTLEGRVGCIDTTNKSKSPTLLPNYFKSQIHKIEWGPLNGNKEDQGLYVVAEGKLVLFNVKGIHKEPQEVDMPDNTYVYTFAWKPNYETLLVSSKAGALIVYSADLKIVSTYYLHRKLQSILWHPNAGEVDSNVSKYCDWFASISNSKEVIVYDFSKESDNNEEKIVAKYSRQGDIINSIAWSPFEADKLVIAGDDGVAQVWDVELDAVRSTFINPNFESILAIIWSPIDPNYIISAGKDRTIRIWNVSDYPVKNDKEVSDLRKKAIKKAASDSSEITENAPQEPPKAKRAHKNNILPNFYSPKTTPQLVADLRRLFLWKEDASNVESLLLGDCKPEILNIFGSHADMFNIVSANEIILKERGKYNLKNTLSLFKGDIGSAIKEAIDEKRVNPWIIMMAPMVSPKLWQTACEVYAQQLSEESDADPLEVATYFLACHKVEDAINALCEGAMFREALALAKCRLPENDVIVTNVIERWASYSVAVGNFENAALCNIFLGKYGDAASVLFRRTDVDLLELAVELAEKAGNEELHKAILFRYNAFKLRNQENGDLPSKVEVVLQKAKLVGNTEGNLNGIETSNGNEEQSIEHEPNLVAESGKDGGLEEEKVKSVDQNSEEVKNVKGEEVSVLVDTEKLDSDLCTVKTTSFNGGSGLPTESDEGPDEETNTEVVGIIPHEPVSLC